jgi:hypothetical protein
MFFLFLPGRLFLSFLLWSILSDLFGFYYCYRFYLFLFFYFFCLSEGMSLVPFYGASGKVWISDVCMVLTMVLTITYSLFRTQRPQRDEMFFFDFLFFYFYFLYFCFLFFAHYLGVNRAGYRYHSDRSTMSEELHQMD